MLARIGHEEDLLLGECVHPGSGGDVVGALGAAVEHDDQGHFLAYVATRDVQLVRTGSGPIGVGSFDEAPPRRNHGRIGLSLPFGPGMSGNPGNPPGMVKGMPSGTVSDKPSGMVNGTLPKSRATRSVVARWPAQVLRQAH